MAGCLNIGYHASEPASPANGDIFYDLTANELKAYIDGAWVALGAGGGSPGGDGTLVQMVHTQTGAVATGTTQIPFDDSIPQNTEGTEFMTLAITPTNSSNVLLIEANVFVTATNTPWIIVALFQDSTANALATTASFNNLSTAGMTIHLRHKMTAGTTSATTFKIRIGHGSGSSTVTFNGQSGGRIFGGVAASSITISEIES